MICCFGRWFVAPPPPNPHPPPHGQSNFPSGVFFFFYLFFFIFFFFCVFFWILRVLNCPPLPIPGVIVKVPFRGKKYGKNCLFNDLFWFLLFFFEKMVLKWLRCETEIQSTWRFSMFKRFTRRPENGSRMDFEGGSKSFFRGKSTWNRKEGCPGKRIVKQSS